MVSLDAHWAEGSAWVCMGGTPDGCGPQFMLGRSDERGIHLPEPRPQVLPSLGNPYDRKSAAAR